MDIKDIESLKKLDEGEWRIFIANKIDKSISIATGAATAADTAAEAAGKAVEAARGIHSIISEQIRSLPCESHTTAIKSLCDWQGKIDEKETGEHLEKVKGGISLKNTIIILILTNGMSVGVTLLTSALSR